MASTLAELAAACRAAPPAALVVLGSGLGEMARRVAPLLRVPFAAVPGLPPSSVAGHRGAFTLGDWAGRRVLLQEGRLHLYEGHPRDVVVRPVRLAAELGVRVALLTNASGGIADGLGPGSLLAVSDHLDAQVPHWYRRPGPGGIGPPRPSPYAPWLREVLGRAAAERGLSLPEGVYAAVLGPNYETPAEVRALRGWGADAVGMSTVAEAAAAVAGGMEVAAVSCVANRAAGLSDQPLSHAEVLAVVTAAAGRLADLLETSLPLLP